MSSSPINIVFCGTPDFAVPSLRALIEDNACNVQLVITQPDKPVGRTQTLTPPPVKKEAEQNGIPIWQPENLSKEFESCPLASPPDFLVVVAYGQILKQHVLDWPSIAPVNVHASLLPRWRGASPMQHAILAGDTITGVTIQRMVAKLDQGPLLNQATVPLDADVIITDLHDQLSHTGANLLRETVLQPIEEQEQDHIKATTCKKVSRANGRVDPKTMTAHEIDRHVRAFVPWPGVTCTIFGEEVKIVRTSLKETECSLAIACTQDTTLHIQQLQSPGKKPMKAIEWMHGKRITT